MKLLALRVAAFRRFSDPAAVEDIGGGVNVLAGPNELGKSTLFHALEAAFLQRHKISGAALDAMRPRAGGDPLVEADFEANGQHWRIRKQFGRSNSAILTDLATGRVEARNAEAEVRLEKLTGGSGELPGRLGLVWVRQQRSLARPDPDHDPQTGKGKPRGEKSALVDAIGQEVEAAVGGELFASVQARASAALDALVTAQRSAVKKNGPLDLAQRQRDDIAKALDDARRLALAAQDRLERIAVASQQLTDLENEQLHANAADRLDIIDARIAAEAKGRSVRDLARETLKTRILEAQAARQSQLALVGSLARLKDMCAARAGAEALEVEIKTFVAGINGNQATPARIERLIALERVLAVSAAELNAQAATVDIAFVPGGAGRLSVDGRPVVENTSLTIAHRSVLDIAGIAAITVTAAGAERAAAAAMRADKASSEIHDSLQAIGVASTDEARALGEQRARYVEQLDRARAHLSGLAPQGALGLAAEIAKTEALSGGADPAKLMSEIAALDASVTTAQRQHEVATAAVLSDDDFRALSFEREEVRAVIERSASDTARLKLRLEGLRGEQMGADEDGRAGQVPGLEGELERADAEARRLDAEVAGLKLLADTLQAIEARTRATYFAPVTKRLQPHLDAVFGSAALDFRDAFALDSLTRAGMREDFATLSDGTREQISVLVRLSFAELLAGRGVAVPLILDDPLVYSDDVRMRALCGVIANATAIPQIIVLTCRETAFSALPGRRLTVTAWRPG